MMPSYVPACPACAINDARYFYVACSGCQARKRELQQRPPSGITQAQVDAMDSTMQPLERDKK